MHLLSSGADDAIARFRLQGTLDKAYKELADSEKARIDTELRVESTASALESHLKENVKAERDRIQHEHDIMKQRFEAEVGQSRGMNVECVTPTLGE